MAGHGGARPGAGAPRGGISETKRLLLRGLTRGLAYAGYKKGLTGTEDEVAVESVARIASDLILSGQGRDVLAILAQSSGKSDEGGTGAKSPLLGALERLPGMAKGTTAALPKPTPAEEPQNIAQDIGAATDPQSVAPFFAPQIPLLQPDAEDITVIEHAPNERSRADENDAAGRPDRPPTPGVAAAHPSPTSRQKS